LKIISNSTAPKDFYYEIVGDGFNWSDSKDDIQAFTTNQEFANYLISNLTADPAIKKVPFIKHQSNFIRNRNLETSLKDVTMVENKKTREKLIQIYQKGAALKQFGRLKGNMEYVEDA
jgi:hypothetical protein